MSLIGLRRFPSATRFDGHRFSIGRLQYMRAHIRCQPLFMRFFKFLTILNLIQHSTLFALMNC